MKNVGDIVTYVGGYQKAFAKGEWNYLQHGDSVTIMNVIQNDMYPYRVHKGSDTVFWLIWDNEMEKEYA